MIFFSHVSGLTECCFICCLYCISYGNYFFGNRFFLSLLSFPLLRSRVLKKNEMNLFLSVRPRTGDANEGLGNSEEDYVWKPNLFDVGPWSCIAPSRNGCVAEEEFMSRSVWDRSDVLTNMRNGKGFFIFSYGPPRSGKTCRLLGGRMARLSKWKDDRAPSTSVVGPGLSSNLSNSNSSVESTVDLEPPPCSFNELRQQYLALLGQESEEEFGENSVLFYFLQLLVKIHSKGKFHVSAVEYFDCEWFDLLSKEVCNLSSPNLCTWKPFKTEEDCISLLAIAQNRRLEPSQPKLSRSVTQLVVQIRFTPNNPVNHSESIAYFVDLAGCSSAGLESEDLDFFHVSVERCLTEIRSELLGKHKKNRRTLIDRFLKNAPCNILKQKQERWRSFLSLVTCQRDPTSIIGVFTIPPTNSSNTSTDLALAFSEQLWKQVLYSSVLRDASPTRNEKERILKRVYGGGYKASSSAVRGAAIRKPYSTAQLADNSTPAVYAACQPSRHRNNNNSGRCRSSRVLSIINATDSTKCTRAALGCMNSQKKDRVYELNFILSKEEHCRLAVVGMERQAREVLWMRWDLISASGTSRSC